MGSSRTATPRTFSSPTADRILLEQEVVRTIDDLVVPHRAKQAYWQLRRWGPAARAAVEQAALFHDDPRIRVQCTVLMDHLAGNESFELMVLLLEDPDPGVRRHAMHALACDKCKSDDVCALPRSELIPTASRLLAGDPDAGVRSMALEVLGRWVHDDGRVREAIERSSDEDPALSVRKKALRYLPGGKHFEETKHKVRH